MKIALVTDFYKPAIGGVNQVVEELAKRYVLAGHEVHVFCSDWDKTKRIAVKDEVLDGVFVHRCKHWFRVANFVTVWPSVFFRLLACKWDVIHSHLSFHPHSFFAAVAAKLKGVRLIHTTHCPWSDAKRSFFGNVMLSLGRFWFIWCTLKFADKIIAITPWEIPMIVKGGGARENIVCIPNGMDKIFFKEIKPNLFKSRLGIKGKLVLFFGRLNPTKGPDMFVRAAHEVLEELPDVSFVLLGPDEGMLAEVKRLIGKEKRIKLSGPTRDKSTLVSMYQSADMYVLPSYREGLPLTLFEAYAAGLPVVASPVNGIPFEMKDGENGLFVQYGDVGGLKRAIIKLLSDKLFAARCSQANRKKAVAYDWDKIAQRTLRLYV
ncbi:MAG: glycosyltransferase family 4 protein [Nanoarchaeota archaeon]|nr:glycosyltransferase family 4 protein [Nanoarchaeota archaeon]